MVDFFEDDFGFPGSSRRGRIPRLPPAVADTLLSQIGRSAMGGLQYVGETLDKGGRAVRGSLSGLTGGDWGGGLLNLVPFSDTMGLTDPAQGVGGRDLLEQWGAVAPNQPGFFNSIPDAAGDVAGLAAEVALDPTILLGIAPLTQAGKAAKAAGSLTRGLAPGIAAGERSLASVGLPFTQGMAVGTGPMAQSVAKGLDVAGDMLRYGNPVGRKLGQWFDPAVRGATTAAGQRFAREELSPAVHEAMGQARLKVMPHMREAYESGILGDNDAIKLMRDALEDPYFDPAAAIQNRWSASTGDRIGAGPSPQQLGVWNKAIDMAPQVKALLPSVEEAQSLGLNVGELIDDFTNYWPRYMHQTENPGIVGTMKEIFRGPSDPVQIARDEALKNVPGGTNKINELVANRAYSSFQRTSGPTKVLNELASELYGVEFKQLPKEEAKGIRRLSQKLKRMPEKYSDPANPQNLFNADPITDLGKRVELDARAKTTADKTLDFLAKGNVTKKMPTRIARGQVYVDSDGSKWMGLRDALSQAGFGQRLKDPETLEYIGKGGPDELAKRMGLKVKDLSRMAIPKELAGDIIGYLKSSGPKQTGAVLHAYDQVTNLFRRTQTLPFPSFLARNVASGIYYNSAAGATDPRFNRFGRGLFQPHKDMTHLLAGKGIDLPTTGKGVIRDQAGNIITSPVQLLDEMTAMGAIRKGVQGTETTQGFSGATRLVEQMPFKQRVKQAVKGSKDPTVLGGEASTYAEDLVRGAHYLAKRRQGYSPQAAADSVMHWHFDYSSAGTTQFEKDVMKRLIPFYTFAKNNTPLVMSELLRHPGGQVAQTMRGILEGQPDPDEGGFIPAYLREGAAIPLGPEQNGTRSYLTGFGLPVEEPFGRVKMGPGGMERTVESLLAMTNPMIKAPLEMLAGKQFFSGRPLNQLDPPLSRTVTNAIETFGGPKLDPRNSPVPLWVEQAVSNSPAARALTTTRQLFDPRKHETPWDVLGLGANVLTGVRTTDVDTSKARREAVDVVEELLRGSPNIRQTTRSYVPKDRQDELTPEEKQLYRLYISTPTRATK